MWKLGPALVNFAVLFFIDPLANSIIPSEAKTVQLRKCLQSRRKAACVTHISRGFFEGPPHLAPWCDPCSHWDVEGLINTEHRCGRGARLLHLLLLSTGFVSQDSRRFLTATDTQVKGAGQDKAQTNSWRF